MYFSSHPFGGLSWKIKTGKFEILRHTTIYRHALTKHSHTTGSSGEESLASSKDFQKIAVILANNCNTGVKTWNKSNSRMLIKPL